MAREKRLGSGDPNVIVERIKLGPNVIRRVYGDGSFTDVCVIENGTMTFGLWRKYDARAGK